MNEGIHYNVPEAAYHADPCEAPSLSSGIARTLLTRSTLHAWHNHPRLNPDHAQTSSKAADAGTVLHKLLLGVGADLVPINAADWRTKAAQDARDEARAHGATPVLVGDLADLHSAAGTIRQRLHSTDDGRLLFEPGQPEATLVWREGPVWCRARCDYLLDDPTLPILDLKTTGMSANPEDWQRALIRDYCIQDAFYRRGLAKLRRSTPPMRFIVAEQDPPHGVSVVCADPSLAARAEHCVERAIGMWAQCLATGQWPGYPTQTAHVAAPAWLLARMEDEAYQEAAQ